MPNSKMYPEGSGGVQERTEAGVIILEDRDGNELLRYDPANQKVIIPAGATLQLNSGCMLQVGGEGVPTADPSVAGEVYANSGVLTVSSG